MEFPPISVRFLKRNSFFSLLSQIFSTRFRCSLSVSRKPSFLRLQQRSLSNCRTVEQSLEFITIIKQYFNNGELQIARHSLRKESRVEKSNTTEEKKKKMFKEKRIFIAKIPGLNTLNSTESSSRIKWKISMHNTSLKVLHEQRQCSSKLYGVSCTEA